MEMDKKLNEFNNKLEEIKKNNIYKKRKCIDR